MVQVAAGRMRNDWYPRRVADYMTQAQLRTLDLKDATFERDFTFGVAQPETKPEAKMEVDRNTLDVGRLPRTGRTWTSNGRLISDLG